LAIELARNVPQPSLLVPDGWIFPWGGRAETTLLVNALALRCLYHLVAIHFGSVRLNLRGGGEDSICMVLTPKQLVDDLELMSSLPRASIREFIEYLTYGAKMRTPDPALQPIVPLGSKNVGVPCLHFLSSNHERNLLSLQARLQPAEFDAMSNLFEREMVARLGNRILQKWPMCRANVELRFIGGNEEIDLLVADRQSFTLLVCELRWMLQPGDPREVQNRKRVCWEKVDQLERKVRRIQENIGLVLQQAFDIPDDDTRKQSWGVAGVVIIETFGGALSRNPEFPIMTAELFQVGMENAPSLAHFEKWCKSLAWLPQEGIDFRVVTRDAEVAGKILKGHGMERLRNQREYREHVISTVLQI